MVKVGRSQDDIRPTPSFTPHNRDVRLLGHWSRRHRRECRYEALTRVILLRYTRKADRDYIIFIYRILSWASEKMLLDEV